MEDQRPKFGANRIPRLAVKLGHVIRINFALHVQRHDQRILCSCRRGDFLDRWKHALGEYVSLLGSRLARRLAALLGRFGAQAWVELRFQRFQQRKIRVVTEGAAVGRLVDVAVFLFEGIVERVQPGALGGQRSIGFVGTLGAHQLAQGIADLDHGFSATR